MTHLSNETQYPFQPDFFSLEMTKAQFVTVQSLNSISGTTFQNFQFSAPRFLGDFYLGLNKYYTKLPNF
jgi:hypothetical protein